MLAQQAALMRKPMIERRTSGQTLPPVVQQIKIQC